MGAGVDRLGGEIPELAAARLPREPGATDRLLASFAAAIDAGVLRAVQTAVDSLLMPRPEQLPELLASAESMLDPALQREPGRFFDFSHAELAITGERSRTLRRLRGGVVLQRRIRARMPRFAALASESDAESVELLGEHWIHDRQTPRATLIAVHGFAMGRPRIDATALFAQQWYRRGLDVFLVTLPHHGARKPSSARFSGETFAVPHVEKLGQAVRQAIFELRVLAVWLRERSGTPVGMLGMSLGGYLTALFAGLDEELDFAIPMVPPVCIGDLAWRFFQRSRHYAAGAAPAFGYDALRAAYRVHSPLAHPLRLPRERVLIVAGRGDRIVPPEHPHSLWDHWGRPGIYWFGGSHLAPFGRAGVVARIEHHLAELGIL